MQFTKTGFHFLLLILLSLPLTSSAQAPPSAGSLESLINQYVYTYGLSPSNRFKLAAYTELKGKYDPDAQAVILDFGALGYLTFYERNCLLRLPGNRIYSLDRYETGTAAVEEMDAQLHSLFERIILMSDGDAEAAHQEFVDRYLAKKNLEPFEKLFIRHVLVHYGSFDPMLQEVVVNSSDLPASGIEVPQGGSLVKQPVLRLKLKLTPTILRGWYLESGGTVFVENVDRNVRFATGEQYDHNVAAFKVFGQKLFVQSVQFIAQSESDRLARLQEERPTMNQMVTIESDIEGSNTFASRREQEIAAAEARWRRAQLNGVQPLYTHTSWIPMMLNMLRNERVNIGDEDVICYFVDLSVFEQIYAQLLPEEKSEVNAYLEDHGREIPAEGWASLRGTVEP